MSDPLAARPFYFIVSFWGAAYRAHFLRLCGASLAAQGNAPSVASRSGNRLILCTTADDWAAIQDDATFRLLAGSLETEFIELRRAVPPFLRPILAEKWRRAGRPVPAGDGWDSVAVTPAETIMPDAYAELARIGAEIGAPLQPSHHYGLRIFFMSAGHKAAACRAHADRAYGVILAPDMVLSDGAVAALDRRARAGAKVVLAPACRFAQEACFAGFAAEGLLAPGRPFAVPPRKLVAMTFAHPHPETACFEFDSPEFCDVATTALWRIPGDRGALLHSFFWAPLLIDFGGIGRHHADYFDSGGTTDGRYLALHFNPDRDVDVVADSDELYMASFTPAAEYYYPVTRSWQKSSPLFATRYKTYLLQKTLHGPMGDAFKRRLYAIPVLIHSGEITDAWRKATLVAAPIAQGAAEAKLGVRAMAVLDPAHYRAAGATARRIVRAPFAAARALLARGRRGAWQAALTALRPLARRPAIRKLASRLFGMRPLDSR